MPYCCNIRRFVNINSPIATKKNSVSGMSSNSSFLIFKNKDFMSVRYSILYYKRQLKRSARLPVLQQVVPAARAVAEPP